MTSIKGTDAITEWARYHRKEYKNITDAVLNYKNSIGRHDIRMDEIYFPNENSASVRLVFCDGGNHVDTIHVTLTGKPIGGSSGPSQYSSPHDPICTRTDFDLNDIENHLRCIEAHVNVLRILIGRRR